MHAGRHRVVATVRVSHTLQSRKGREIMSITDVRAMVQTGPRAVELRQLARPVIGDDEALIRVEACGICGTDIGMYHDGHGAEFPLIRGHEPVGTIEEIGATHAGRTGLRVGDRVAVDPFIRCGTCRYCLGGRGELCEGGGSGREHNTFAMIPLDVGSGLWGGFATHLVASGQTVLYRVPTHVPATKAALFNALGAGVKWTLDAGGVRQGSTVVILGGGQRGLSCAIAALETGATFVAVTGLARDHHKLALARDLGVHAAIDVEAESVHDVVGRMVGRVDVVVDTTPGATQSILDAIQLVRTGGTIVSGGIKRRPVEEFPIDELTRKEITLKGVLGTGADHYRRAIDIIAGSTRPIERMQTHLVPLEQLEHGIALLAGEVPGEEPIAVVIDTR
jgi:threonine dehydrogenase-like Zn-dependent dehydrogenase